MFRKQFDTILDKIASEIEKLETYNTDISEQMENFVAQNFEKHMGKKLKEKQKHRASSRGEKTIVFPCSSLNKYNKIITDRKIFKETVLKNLCFAQQTSHKDTCTGENSYTLSGFRSNVRKVKMKDDWQHDCPIRMIKCSSCGEKFSLLPSFLPREKHFSIEIIGSVVRNVLLFNSSIRAVMETLMLGNARKITSPFSKIGQV